MFGPTDPGEALPGMRWRLGVPRVEEFSVFSDDSVMKKSPLAPAGICSTLRHLSQRSNSILVNVEADSIEKWGMEQVREKRKI